MGINILLQEGMEMFYILLWEWDGNGNTVIGMEENGIEKVIPAHLYLYCNLPVTSNIYWTHSSLDLFPCGADYFLKLS